MLLAVVTLASCRNEDVPIGPAPGEPQTVTITVSAAEEMRTRTVSETEDNELTRCYMQIDGGVPVEMTTTDNKNFTTSTTLTIGESCKFYFWADDGSYTVNGLAAVTEGSTTGIAYAGSASWDGSSSSVSAELKLVVSKVTLKTTTALTGAHVSLTIPDTYDGYNVTNASPIPITNSFSCSETVTTEAGGEVFSFYVLAGEGEQDLTLTCGNTVTVSNVPFAPGRHTILSGDLNRLTQQSVDVSAAITDSWGVQQIDLDAIEVDLSALSGGYVIDDDNAYRLTGSTQYPVTITSSAMVTLQNAQINVGSGNAVDIRSGNPTIQIIGTNNISVNEEAHGAGIYVAEGSSVTITGPGVDDVLVVTGGSAGAGIGGYFSSDDYESHPCGDITIENVTVKATSNPPLMEGYAAAIGAVGDKAVGKISINNAVVTAVARGGATLGAAAIGGGTGGIQTPMDFDITISNSELHLSRGNSNASYIGAGGSEPGPAGYDIISTAVITNSRIYDENGNEITPTME